MLKGPSPANFPARVHIMNANSRIHSSVMVRTQASSIPRQIRGRAGFAPSPRDPLQFRAVGGNELTRNHTFRTFHQPSQSFSTQINSKASDEPEVTPTPSSTEESPNPSPPKEVHFRNAFGALKWVLYATAAVALINPGYVATTYFQIGITPFVNHIVRCLGAVCLMLTATTYYLQEAARDRAQLDEVACQRVGTSMIVMCAFLTLLDMPASHRSYFPFLAFTVCIPFCKGSLYTLIIGTLDVTKDIVQEAGKATQAAKYALLAITHSLWAGALMFFPEFFTKVFFDSTAIKLESGLRCLLRTVGAGHLPLMAMLYVLLEDARARESFSPDVLSPRMLRVLHVSLVGFAGVMLGTHLHAIFVAGITAPVLYSLSITLGSFLPAVLVVCGVMFPRKTAPVGSSAGDDK